MVPAPHTTQATSLSVPVNTITQSIPVSLPEVPISDISSNSFNFPLQNVFDRIERISNDDLDFPRPVLEVVSLDVHNDVQPIEVVRSHQTSREVLENPMVTVVTKLLLDGVEHNHMSLRKLVESPKGSNERVTHSSPLRCEDIRPVIVVQITHTSR